MRYGLTAYCRKKGGSMIDRNADGICTATWARFGLAAMALLAALVACALAVPGAAHAASFNAKTGVYTFDANSEVKAMAKTVDVGFDKGVYPDANGVKVKAGAVKAVKFGDAVTTIPANTFWGQKTLVTVKLNKVAKVGSSAFENCTKLKKVSAPQVVTIGSNAFFGCKSLTGISLKKTTKIGMAAFGSCEKLAKVTLNKVKSIGVEAFMGCGKLKKVVIGGTALKSVGRSALATAKGKTVTLKVPKAKVKAYKKLFTGKAARTSGCLNNYSSKISVKAL
ncbi:MAG: leucine-rich repeat domain-containing protein [Coriobacteriaceae bacterium]|nr:leucine-rich repeat domain-containing protein [Coriobacteriaceae bacterium]